MRGKRAPKRQIQPDEVYNSTEVSKLINFIMIGGKKTVARKLVHTALEDFAKQVKTEPTAALTQVIDNVKPKIEIRPRRVGGANYLVPTPVSGDRQIQLTFRWIVEASRKNRGRKESWESLRDELIAAYKGEGNAIKKREEVERMAEANRAFASYSPAA